MRKESADNVIQSNQLVRGSISRKILKCIQEDLPIKQSDLPEGISVERIKKIRAIYQEKTEEFKGIATLPRNVVFYHLIKELVPDFVWHIKDSQLYTKPKIDIHAPRVHNLRPSLLSLLLNQIDAEHDTFLHRKYQCVKSLSASMIKDLTAMMQKLDIIYPNEFQMRQIVGWLQKGLQGEALTIFSAICPDYSVEPTGNPDCPFRHTFDTVGSGNGLIAQRILNALPTISKLLTDWKVNFKIIAGVGNFEAFSEANLQRVKLTEEEFLNRVGKSKMVFENVCAVPCEVHMITELCDGKQAWLKSVAYYHDKFNRNEFGLSGITRKTLLDIARKRKNLYNRWYGEKNLLDEYLAYVINQGIEYAAIGAIIGKRFNNCFILGADNDVMAPFYSIEQVIPSLYLKRFYC